MVKNGCGGLDRGTKGWRLDHGRLALGYVNEQVYMCGHGVEGVDQVKMAVD